MRIRPLTDLAVVATLVLLPETARAYLAWSETRAIESASGKYLLVLLMPIADRTERPSPADYVPSPNDRRSQKDLQDWKARYQREVTLEAKYPRSGLYRNDGSTNLLWAIPYIGICRDVLVADDGVHLVTIKMNGNCTDGSDPRFTSLDFYASGKLAATYDDWSFLPFFGARILLAEWFKIYRPSPNDYRTDLKGTKFTVQTNQHDTLTFDIVTGKRIRCRSPWTFYFAVPIFAVPLGLRLSRRRLHGEVGALVDPRGSLRFSVRDMLGWMAILAAAVTAVKFGGWAGGFCSLIAVIGAGVARMRGGTARAIAVGALIACYAAYLVVLLSTAADSMFFDDYQVLRLWASEGWGRAIPLTVVVFAALTGGWLGGRLCSPATRAACAPRP